MNTTSLRVNGRPVDTHTQPRTHLGDFLRDELGLTGTHLSCEHGVCGACTVLMDGHPVRSCITFTTACAGHEITTIEGFEDDHVMQLLRLSFSRHHALQCGFCTPGMLATARDIVLRLPDANEARVRVELAGNICRCTGYQGIVDAVLDVLEQARSAPDTDTRVDEQRDALRRQPAIPAGRTDARAHANVGGGHSPSQAMAAADPVMTSESTSASPQSAGTAATPDDAKQNADSLRRKGSVIETSFEVPFTVDRVWAFMGNLSEVASCLPGASIESDEGDRVKGRIKISFGPISAAFVGAAKLERNDEAKRGVLKGAGQDTLSQSRAQGDIAYQLAALDDGSTRVEVEMAYALQGPLAQFSRSGLVKDFVRRMVADFGQKVSQRLSGDPCPAVPATSAPMSVTRIVWSVVTEKLRSLFHRPRA